MVANRERAAMLLFLALAAAGCLLALAHPPPLGAHAGKGEQLLDLVRVAGAAGLGVTLLLGPGLLWRASSSRPIELAFLPLPGLLLLTATGGLAWALAGSVEPELVCFAISAPALGLLAGALLAAGPEPLLDGEERWVLLVVGCALGLAIARAIWSLGPEGELYAGTISRTLEVGDRPDSRISYHVVQLIAHGNGPYSEAAGTYLAPYNFSSRGPIAGLASAPIVLMSGGKPPLTLPEDPWQPFDAQGFMAYRMAMMAFAGTAFLAVWDLTRRLGGHQAARVAVLLAATTPFLVHEIWFTWPKLLAAYLVLLAAICVVARRPLAAGLLAGLGYLVHPGALLALSALTLLALWPLSGAVWRRPKIGSALLLLAAAAAGVIAWRLLNGDHYTQDGFFEYLTSTEFNFAPSAGQWLVHRAASVGNTLLPLLLPLASADSSSINVVGGTSPPAIHFFFEYWNSLPFAVGIVFFPLLLVSLWRAALRWPWAVFATVVVPFVGFAIYWGSFKSGLMREGLQAWALVLFVVVAMQQWDAGFPWFRSRPIRALLTLRTVELLLIAIGPTLVTRHQLVSSAFALSDFAAVIGMVGFSACLAILVWSLHPDQPGEQRRGDGVPRPRALAFLDRARASRPPAPATAADARR